MLLFTGTTSLYINSSKNLIKCRRYDSCLSPVHARCRGVPDTVLLAPGTPAWTWAPPPPAGTLGKASALTALSRFHSEF